MQRRSSDSKTAIDKVRPLEIEPALFKNYEAAVKKFRKLVQKEGIIQEAKRRAYYTKPSREKFLKKQAAKHRRELEKKHGRRVQRR